VKLLPSSNEGLKSNLGGLSSLAGLAGINLNTTSENFINPEIYPQITGSVPFLMEVLDKKIYFSGRDTTVTTFNYLKYLYRPSLFEFLKKYTIALPFTLRKLLSSDKDSNELKNDNNDIIKLSKEDTKLIEKFKDQINSEYDNETGILSISVTMSDANAAAEIANLTFKLLQEYLIEFKSEKAKENLDFLEARYNESKSQYEKLQAELAQYTDQNQNVTLARAQIEQQNIQNEYNLAFEIYKSLANQLEQAKIKVKEDSPILSVLDPPKIPVEKSSPRRLLILIIFGFLGLIIGISIIIFNEQINEFKNALKNKAG
jgi:uncharacterized protein involved in exopolysaccharide biosynthesis